jgi:hypothetical protein
MAGPLRRRLCETFSFCWVFLVCCISDQAR